MACIEGQVVGCPYVELVYYILCITADERLHGRTARDLPTVNAYLIVLTLPAPVLLHVLL